MVAKQQEERKGAPMSSGLTKCTWKGCDEGLRRDRQPARVAELPRDRGRFGRRLVPAQESSRWREPVCRVSARPPEIEEARQALDRIVKDSGRVDAVIDRIRALVKRAPQRQDRLTINEVILEVVALTRTEAARQKPRASSTAPPTGASSTYANPLHIPYAPRRE
jgi:hypothetical protein